jgi:hypothetical protein
LRLSLFSQYLIKTMFLILYIGEPILLSHIQLWSELCKVKIIRNVIEFDARHVNVHLSMQHSPCYSILIF